FSTRVDYGVGLSMGKRSDRSERKRLLWISLVANLGLLGFFKYYNFFVDNFVEAFSFFGQEISTNTLNIILPVGISFYTFQTLSYTIDVYRKKIEPTKDLVQFAAYVAFFPQLVAGPIERATNLLPQFMRSRIFDQHYARTGFNLIIWGLFKKVVVADNCAFFVNTIFESPGSYSAPELFLGAVLFGLQIYGDFSGYSDIAIGTARLFGFDLMTNFSFPYFSRDIAEFWRRWHISLSTWFRDYLYIPMGGSRGPLNQKLRNVLVVFLVSGFWHGANWTFIIWGAIHALMFVPLLMFKVHRTHISSTRLNLWQLPQVMITFALVTLAWVFFRADTVTLAFDYLKHAFDFSDLSINAFTVNSKSMLFALIIMLSSAIMLLMEFNCVQSEKKEVQFKGILAVGIMLLIVFMGVFKNPSDFIYFQF
ncbi:MAG: MBOAT family protein, partial [Flavobacteriaceae bacterium]|nr:MBOAT family protein [Flavobacteriaceae bacterium]